MPQMYPMNWIFMFFIFMMIFIISMNKIFYSPDIKSNILNETSSMKIYSNIWKW